MHVIHGQLRKAPFIKPNVGQNGDSTLFIVELSEVIKDRQTNENTYTNYSAAIFAKGGQIDFYNNTLVEGNFIVVTGDKLKIKVSDCGKYTKLELENARLEGSGYVGNNNQQNTQPSGFQQQPQMQQQAPQQNYQQPQQQMQQPTPQQVHQKPQQQAAPMQQQMSGAQSQNWQQSTPMQQPQQPTNQNQSQSQQQSTNQNQQPQVEGGFDSDIPF